VENVDLTREEFISVVEAFVLDKEEQADEDDDYRQLCQRRHLNTMAGLTSHNCSSPPLPLSPSPPVCPLPFCMYASGCEGRDPCL
jgi:hypothetical protein